jgi:hypothetical protein
LLVLGNSITQHGYDSSIGWTGTWGMAASAQANDFVHLTGVALNLPPSANNIATIEQNPSAAAGTLGTIGPLVGKGTDVVVELGDNVMDADLATFQPVYAQLLSAASARRSLVCLSTFWQRSDIDQMIQAQCAAAGGTYVYIGDIYTNPANPDYQGTPAFSDPAVNMHPHDWSMNQISIRIAAALTP